MKAWQALLASALAGLVMPAQALVIEFDYRFDTRGFFTDSATGAPLAERRALLDMAASFYSGFSDALAAVAPAAGDRWSVTLTHPSLAGPRLTLSNLGIAANTLRVFVGGSPSAPGVLGFANNGSGLVATGSAGFVDAVTTRGQANTHGAGATDFGPWGGMIWFNAANAWYFGADAGGLSAGRPDFLTTATHELGHILGFGDADSWRPQTAGQRFTGAAAVAAYGGAVPLDGFGVHWAEGVSSLRNGLPQETLMDPSTPAGDRELPTVLDYAGFADIGWQVAAVPEPAPSALLLMGLVMVGWLSGRRGRLLQGRGCAVVVAVRG